MARRFKKTSVQKHTAPRPSWVKAFLLVLLLALLMAAVLVKKLNLWR